MKLSVACIAILVFNSVKGTSSKKPIHQHLRRKPLPPNSNTTDIKQQSVNLTADVDNKDVPLGQFPEDVSNVNGENRTKELPLPTGPDGQMYNNDSIGGCRIGMRCYDYVYVVRDPPVTRRPPRKYVPLWYYLYSLFFRPPAPRRKPRPVVYVYSPRPPIAPYIPPPPPVWPAWPPWPQFKPYSQPFPPQWPPPGYYPPKPSEPPKNYPFWPPNTPQWPPSQPQTPSAAPPATTPIPPRPPILMSLISSFFKRITGSRTPSGPPLLGITPPPPPSLNRPFPPITFPTPGPPRPKPTPPQDWPPKDWPAGWPAFPSWPSDPNPMRILEPNPTEPAAPARSRGTSSSHRKRTTGPVSIFKVLQDVFRPNRRNTSFNQPRHDELD